MVVNIIWRRLPPIALDIALAAALCALDLVISWDPTRTVEQPKWAVVAFAVAGYSVLVARRRHPLVTLFLMVAFSVLATVVFVGFIPTLGVWLALYTAAAHLELAQAVLALVLAAVPAGLNVADSVGRQLPEDKATALVGTMVALTLINATIFGVGR
jgi:hypothetical protein